MNILVVCQYYAPEPFRIPDICEALVSRGHRVTVVTGTPNYPEGVIYPGYENGNHRDEVIDGVNVHRCPLIPRKQGILYRFLNYYSFPYYAKRYLKGLKDDFDVVFANQLSPVMMAEPALFWAKKHRKKCVLYCLDLWPESLVMGGISAGSPIYRFFLWVSRRIYRRADAIAVTSGGFIDYFQNTLGIQKPITHIPQYAEALFENLPEPQKDPGYVDFVFAGNVGTTQSVETIVEAGRLLKDEKQIRIHIVGGGISLDACKEQAEGLSNVIFYGRRSLEDMPAFYAMADAMLITLVKNPTMSLTLPGKAQSYMAAGKPMIGCADGETRRVIEKAHCGLCAPAEDAAALADCIRRAAEDPERCKAWGDRAKDYYQKNFRKEVFLDSLMRLLEENA